MIKKAINIGVIILASLLFASALLYFVPYSEKVSFSLQGTAYQATSDDTSPCTVSFDGYLQHYLFKSPQLKGTLSVESDFRSYTADFSGPYFSASLGETKENANWTVFDRYQENVNRAVVHTLAFTDDRKTAYVSDWEEDYFYCVSSLPAERAQEIYDQLLAFYHN